MHTLNKVFSALISLNGFNNAHRTSIMQRIKFRTGRKNLYNIRKGVNFDNKSFTPL